MFQDVIRIIEMNTSIRRHPHTKRFFWLANFNISSPATVFLALELSRWASGPLVDYAWRAVVANYDAREAFYLSRIRSQIFGIFSRLFIKAWEIRKEALKDTSDDATIPRVILMMRGALAAQTHSTAIQVSPENDITACLKVHAPLDFDFPSVSAPGDTTSLTYVEVDDGQRPLKLID